MKSFEKIDEKLLILKSRKKVKSLKMSQKIYLDLQNTELFIRFE